MGNSDKYIKVFVEIFEIKESELENLEYQSIEAWDSIGHMGLVAEIEDVFDITFETDDIIDLSSFNKGKEILLKYGIEV